jgi:4-hydroxybenzoyl-CoA thioesterase
MPGSPILIGLKRSSSSSDLPREGSMFANTRTWIVEWGDCDAAGIVFFPRFFAAFDTSTARLIEAAARMRQAEILQANDIVGWSLVDSAARFIAPASFGDSLDIATRITRVGRSSFALEHHLSKDGATCVEATEVRVWMARRSDGSPTMESRPIPNELAARLRGD